MAQNNLKRDRLNQLRFKRLKISADLMLWLHVK